ncbi:MAG: hypothetical protein Ta2D_10220 [Rickettsiales bacterium]|nr:MAG: hypothetical protein Ta2D_10220 [Rickettsiales bacterium]
MTETKFKPQLYKDTKDFQRWNSYFDITNFFDNMKMLYNNKERIIKFADIIIDNDILPIAKLVNRQQLRILFGFLIDIWIKCGTSVSYERFFKSIFGEQTEITFTISAPKVLKLDIGNYSLSVMKWKIEQESRTFMQSENNEILLFSEIMSDVAFNSVIEFLQFIKPRNDILLVNFLTT